MKYNDVRQEVKKAVTMLSELIEGGYVESYNVVEMMDSDLRDKLGDALYAYSANQTAMTGEWDDFLTEDYDSERQQVLDELTSLSQGMGDYD